MLNINIYKKNIVIINYYKILKNRNGEIDIDYSYFKDTYLL